MSIGRDPQEEKLTNKNKTVITALKKQEMVTSTACLLGTYQPGWEQM